MLVPAVRSIGLAARLTISSHKYQKKLLGEKGWGQVVWGQRSFHLGSCRSDIFNVQDEADFKAKVKDTNKPVVVQFHASWCGPCKQLGPRLEKAMVKFSKDVDMAKVDIDALPELAMEYNVGAVPSVLAIKGGDVLDKFVGLKDDDQIDTFIAAIAKK